MQKEEQQERRTGCWMKKIKSIVAVVALLAAIAGVLAFFQINYSTIRDWLAYNFPSEKAPYEQLTILIAHFRFDVEGKVTREIEDGLNKQGWESILIRRTLITTEELVENSRKKKISVKKAVSDIFNKYGGDVLVTGEFSAIENQVRVQIFSKVIGTSWNIKLDLSEEWTEILMPYIEEAVLGDIIAEGKRQLGEFEDEYIRRILPIESKVMELFEVASTENLQEEIEKEHRRLSISIGIHFGDAERLRQERKRLEKRLSENHFKNIDDQIIALGNVADLLRIEGLALGNPELLNSSFKMSKEVRKLLGVSDEGLAYEKGLEENEIYRVTLEIESAVAIACKDGQRIDELLKIYEQAAMCSTESLDMGCPPWSTRGIFALRYARAAWSERAQLVQSAADVTDWWNSGGYGGLIGHWADPMNHTARLLRSRLKTDPDIHRLTLLDNIPKKSACPDLIRLAVLSPTPVEE